MTAVIIASQRYPEMHGIDDHLPLCLFPLVDRPLLHHIVEYVVGLGIRKFEFILSHLPERLEAFLGDGTRWGCTFRFHLITDAASPYLVARAIAAPSEDAILLGSADCLPEIETPLGSNPVMFFAAPGDWSGWAVLPHGWAPHINAIDAPTSGMVAEILSKDCPKVIVKHTISFRSGSELLLSQQRLMAGEFAGLQIGGRQSERGVWISRNVSIHPTVNLQAPVYIGPNCRIGRGSQIGPCAVISENCILDSLSSVENSVIASGTYIGRGLELNQVLIDRNLLVNVKIGTSFTASETFLLSGLMGHTRHRPLQQIFSFLGALTLLLIFLPAAALIYLYMTISRKGVLYLERAVSIPADDNPGSWREYLIPRFRAHKPERPTRWKLFFFQFWPGLLAVLRGDLLLVGVQPRTHAAICELPNDWKSIYLKSRAGLITEAFVMFGSMATEDEVYTAEAYYSATGTIRHDLRLACLYLRSLILVPGKTQDGVVE